MSAIGWVNGYTCDTCNDTIWTVTVDEGVTPMLMVRREMT